VSKVARLKPRRRGGTGCFAVASQRCLSSISGLSPLPRPSPPPQSAAARCKRRAPPATQPRVIPLRIVSHALLFDSTPAFLPPPPASKRTSTFPSLLRGEVPTPSEYEPLPRGLPQPTPRPSQTSTVIKRREHRPPAPLASSLPSPCELTWKSRSAATTPRFLREHSNIPHRIAHARGQEHSSHFRAFLQMSLRASSCAAPQRLGFLQPSFRIAMCSCLRR